MDVLATRTLTYRHDSGKETGVTVTVFLPFLTERSDWKCEFQFSPPDTRRALHAYGVDFIQALLGCLQVARGYIEHPTEDRTHWQGMSHSGLPWPDKIPPGYQPLPVVAAEETRRTLDILTTRRLSIPHGANDVHELILHVYRPFQDDGGTWKCAFSFDPMETQSIRYGTGADFIEAVLDALAMARIAFEAMVPVGWTGTDELLDCADFPIKIGRSFRIARPAKQ